MATCSKCSCDKTPDEFPLHNGSPRLVWCKQCYMNDHQRRRNSLMFELDGVVRSGLQLRRKYGMSPEAYVAIYNSQNGLCAICGQKPEDRILVVDHNHTTGEIRELLCKFCNWTIGHAQENTSILASAIQYLEKHNV